MREGSRRLLAHVIAAFYIAAMIVTFILRAIAHASIFDAFFIPFTSCTLVGWLIAIRKPRTPLAWVFLSIGGFTALGVLSDAFVSLADSRGWSPHGLVLAAAWVQLWFWYPLLLLSTLYTLVLFPEGLPSRRWRPMVWVVSVTLVAMVLAAALTPRIDVGKRHVPNPIGLRWLPDNVEHTRLFSLAGPIIIIGLLGAVVSLGIRFRRSHGIERAQLKWFFLGAAFLGLFITASLTSRSFDNSTANNILSPIALTAMPVSCGLAILRYRLYDIDRLVSRTLSYFVVTGAVAGVYVGVVALIESVLGFSSSVAVAASTLAAAAAFQPLRSRVQRVVDRRFDRAAYDARRTVEAFSARLRDEVDVDTVRADLLTTVSLAIAPTTASLWVAT
jgi:MFS family permease